MSSFLISSFSTASSDGIQLMIVNAKHSLPVSLEKTQVVLADMKAGFGGRAGGSSALRRKSVGTRYQSEFLVVEAHSGNGLANAKNETVAVVRQRFPYARCASNADGGVIFAAFQFTYWRNRPV
jgi:hypothetical protein